MKALRITDWPKYYETAESRKLVNLLWVATPNGHDSMGFCEILSHPNGMAHYGAWNLILQLASRCPTRGLLVTGKGKAHDARSIALVTRGNEKVIREAIVRLLEIGWLQELELEQSPRVPGDDQEIPADSPGHRGGEDTTVQDRGGDGRRGRAAPDPLERVAKALTAGGLKAGPKQVKEWKELMTGIGQCRTVTEAVEGISWIVVAAETRKISVKYYEDAKELAAEWGRHLAEIDRQKAKPEEART
jgi:hypothetical protein